MATMTFSDDTITGLPGAGVGTNTFVPGGVPYTFNPFSTDVGVVDGGGADEVTLRLIFSDQDPGGVGTDGAVLVFTENGSATTMTQSGGAQATFTMIGAAATVQTWLQSMYIVADNLNDGFKIALRSVTGAGTNLGSAYSFAWVLACYTRGTMIRTPAGERAVEALQGGDLVTTLDGSAKKVKWIGHRSYEAEFGAGEAFVRPVLIRAGALGNGLPTRDLKVSPQHAMLIDGVMVPAAALVNGVSILRDETVTDVTYFHIEMEGHEAIFAEGAASETFVDHNSRAIFDNADEYAMLFGNAATEVQEFARLEEGFQLAAIRRHLAEIAGIPAAPAAAGALLGKLERIEAGVLHGWVIDTASADSVEADVLVDGEVVARVVANRYRADLDQARLAGGRGGFTVALPASADSLAQVSLRRVTDGQVLDAVVVETAAV